MNNEKKFYANTALWTVITLFTTGGMVQTLLSENGFSLQQISTYSALASATQTLCIVLNIFVSDRIRRVKQTFALLSLAPLILFAVLIPLCFAPSGTADAFFPFISVACVAVSLLLGFYTVLAYRIPYKIIDMQRYTELTSKAGVWSGVCSVAVSTLITLLSAKFPFRPVMGGALALSTFFCLLCVVIVLRMKEIPDAHGEPAAQSFSLKTLWSPPFRWFYVPNVLRGLAMGYINMISVIYIRQFGNDATFLSVLVTLLSLSAIIGSFLCALMSRRMSCVDQYVIFGSVMGILFPLLVLFDSSVWFAAVFLIIGVVYNIISIVAAAHATQIVAYENIGMYSSVRMICLSLGQTLAAAGIGALIDHVPVLVVLLGGCIFQLLSCASYFLYEKRYPAGKF